MWHDAFISYSRKGEAFSAQLEKALEAFTPPKGLGFPNRQTGVLGRTPRVGTSAPRCPSPRETASVSRSLPSGHRASNHSPLATGTKLCGTFALPALFVPAETTIEAVPRNQIQRNSP